ncbi:MAG: hypothetical protein ACRDWW_05595, partial [Acidimicrobiales bacterium]
GGADLAVVGWVAGGAVVAGLVVGGGVVVVVVLAGAVVVGIVIEDPPAGVVGPSAGRAGNAHATAPGTLGMASSATAATTDAAARRERWVGRASNFNL